MASAPLNEDVERWPPSAATSPLVSQYPTFASLAAACLSPERQPPVASTSGAPSEHRRYERGHVQEVTRIDKTRSPRATRSPDRDLHASDELARVLSPEALHSSSPPRTGPVQRRHYHGRGASASVRERRICYTPAHEGAPHRPARPLPRGFRDNTASLAPGARLCGGGGGGCRTYPSR